MADEVKAQILSSLRNAREVMETIGIIDDDEESSSIISAFLEESFHVLAFEDWKTGLKAFEKHPPALILLNISLNGIRGEEVLKMIRNKSSLQNIKVIALTGYSQPDARTEFLKIGFDEYLSKPITNVDFFIKVIKRCLG